MKRQDLGSKAALHNTDNLSMEPTGRTGNPLVQSFAGEAPMSNVPVPTWPIEPGTGHALRQSFGGSAPISATPVKGWGSAPTPLSERAEKQSR